ncbi:DUF418 domain-containing protein [Parasphingorhabdus sp.]|uniref:DUF418 domain-containing protein n=1 Tax=Parasphingorhabdus sp. TaxID=2709688 RepID=UPI003C793E02
MGASQRYLEMDALRGFAVMGILLMNIIGFSMPEMAYINPAVYGGTDTPDIIAWFASFLLVDGKMRGLFTFLFGASLILICERSEAKGESPAKTHFSRMFWLALFGLAHFFFLWWGDILFLYAAIGCAAYFLRLWPAEKLIRSAIILYLLGFVIYSGFMGSLIYLQHAAEAAGAGSDPDKQYQDAMIGIAPSAGEITEEVSRYLTGYAELVRYRVAEQWFAPLGVIVQNFLETLPFMMFGMALYKNGFLTGSWEASRYRRVATISLLIGLAILIPIGILILSQNFEPLLTLNAVMAWSMPSRLLMTIGYLALLVLFIQKFATSRLIHRVAAAGRAAFSNYLGTSLLMTFIFYGWGLGYYGSVGRAELYLFVLGAWALMLLWSQPWLMRFRYGPLEWLWRSLAKGQAQPMQIDKT